MSNSIKTENRRCMYCNNYVADSARTMGETGPCFTHAACETREREYMGLTPEPPETEIARLRTRIAELEAERDQALKILKFGTCPDPNCDNNGTTSSYDGEPEPCQWCDERNEALARTDTDCCNQPDQCWEPCGDLSKSEAHAKPVTKIDPPSGPPPGPPDPPPYIPPKQG